MKKPVNKESHKKTDDRMKVRVQGTVTIWKYQDTPLTRTWDETEVPNNRKSIDERIGLL